METVASRWDRQAPARGSTGGSLLPRKTSTSRWTSRLAGGLQDVGSDRASRVMAERAAQLEEAWLMSVARPHTRPHTNRRDRRCGVELKRSPRSVSRRR